ncbi:2'-deoxycytidine 5'-triphosphate deaminase [Engelhardtia mirabilis]|uniref:2'-deoxycytidine 5'-triphosphate deaminase n=1 Tax=Engelhardtia mirabilis TaxID=2528011 RepID=A0A518BJP4_9BACT|nr:2'-deoxycytidine 5'-triphosphate deaminase [Planctomycetes bacterium Pla133]QDV01502.1 2'-deoxycytidine 5'-triphosphate deaminase [Planctomycetes bacterium Pla86]
MTQTQANPSGPIDVSGASEGGVTFVDRELEALLGTALRSAEGSPPIEVRQIQPASLDLRLGGRVTNLRCGFLPERSDLESRLAELTIHEEELSGDGAILKRGQVYLIPLAEYLDLPPGVVARFNPRSSSGRCDLFCRVLVPGHPRFDETPPGYRGPLWLEVVPLSFPVRLRRGDRLVQLRLQDGPCALTEEELRAVYRETPLAFDGDRALPEEEVRFTEDGSLELRIGLTGRKPCGWRAALHTAVVDFASDGVHDRFDFWESVYSRGSGGACILDPGRFYIFASRERIVIPPHLAAEMLPVDVGVGELRNNYAGFFDNGFGWREDEHGRALGCGTPAVLEVRAHDVPFLLEDGQVFFRLRFFRASGRPRNLYGHGRPGPSYGDQDLTLARPFRA